MSAQELNNTVLKNSANLKAYYRFESGALTTDSSGNGYTLTNNGTIAGTTGVFGGASDFTNANTTKYYSIISGPITGTSARTIAGWCYQYQIDGNAQAFFGIGSSASTRNTFNFYTGATTGELQVICFGDNLTSGVNATAGVWFHAAITYDGSSVIRLYINGKHIASKTLGGALNTDAVLTIGKSPYEAVYADAIVDDVGVFNTALSADQIKELYEGRTVGELWPQSGLVGLWHLNGNSTDFSGNNNHGTDTAITYSQANGKFGQGAGFNGSSSKITVANSTSVQTGDIDYTIGMWVNLSSAGFRTLISKQTDSSVREFVLWYDTTGAVATNKFLWRVNKDGVGNGDVQSLTSLSTGVWAFVVVWHDSVNNQVGISTNGGSINTASYSSGSTANTQSLVIGEEGTTNTRYWAGAIDEVFFIKRVLTPQEIRKWYAWSVGKFQ